MSAAPDRSASGSWPAPRSSPASRRSSATSTSTGTAAATRTGSSAHRIPIGSRVILACHAYVGDDGRRARTATRSPATEAVAELRAGAGTKFDPDVVDALLDLLGHDAPDGAADRAAGVKLVAPPPARAYVPSVAGCRVGYRAGDQRRRVGQPRLVEAAVLRDLLERALRGLRRRCRRTCPWARDARHEEWSVSSGVSAGAQVGTVSAMT